jgi:hypothetical protein
MPDCLLPESRCLPDFLPLFCPWSLFFSGSTSDFLYTAPDMLSAVFRKEPALGKNHCSSQILYEYEIFSFRFYLLLQNAQLVSQFPKQTNL